MCLNSLYKKPRLFRQCKAYKVVYFAIHTADKDHAFSPYMNCEFDLKNWNTAKKHAKPRMLVCHETGQRYQSGMHCYLRKADALRFFAHKLRNESSRYGLFQVAVEEITAFGEDWFGRTVVAQRMKFVKRIA